jgi:hypothetical protein
MRKLTMVKERPLAIKLHNPTNYIVWQYVLLISGFLLITTTRLNDVYGYGILSLLVLLLCACYFLKPQPLILTNTNIFLPQEVMKEYSLQSIKSVKLTRYTHLEFEIAKQNETKKESLDLCYLSKEDANLLWLWIGKHLSHARIDSQTREDLLNWRQYRTLAIDQSKNKEPSSNLANENTQMELTFTPQSLLSASPGLKSLLIKISGQIWLTLCLIYCTAILLSITSSEISGKLLSQSSTIFLFVFLINQTPLVLYDICPKDALGIIALLVTIPLITCSLIRQTRPNSAFIDHLGLTLQYRQLVSREADAYSTIFHSHIPWPAIGRVRLYKTFPLSAAPDYLLFERVDDKPPFSLPLNFMRTNKEKQRLLSLLQKYQDNHNYQIDTLVLDCLKGTSSYTPEYTQLWLKNLHQKQETELDISSQATVSVCRPKLEIVKEIASGGQAMTYKAKKKGTVNETNYQRDDEEQTIEELIVLKEFFLPIKNETIYQTQVTKFEKAVALLKALHHPNLVRIDDYFIDGQKACLILEYIEGSTLAESILKDGVLSELKAVDLAMSMCDILTYLHGQNPPLLHLDFTPENLILDNKNQLKLIDLDSCLVHRESATQSQYSSSSRNQTIIGKQNYIPREQFQGHPEIRSDIFALGATLFYLTTAEKPEAFATLHPRKYNEALSEGFDAIVGKAASVLADDRYSSAEELKREFLLLKGSLVADGGINTTTQIPTTTIVTETKETKEKPVVYGVKSVDDHHN